VKKSQLIKIIKEEIVDVIKERDYSEPVETGAFANLQTALKTNDKDQIKAALGHVKASSIGQGAMASAFLALGTWLAGTTGFATGTSYSNTGSAVQQATEEMVRTAALSFLQRLPTDVQVKLYQQLFKVWKESSSSALTQFMHRASAIVNKAK
jgi:hypothetical protein